MSYQAIVYNILVASPGDVEHERRIVREKVHKWNEIHAAPTNVVLQPIGWETHAVPEMGDRPQAIINDQLVDHCDMLVGVFWTRLGTPTGKAASGTSEEIERFIKGRKTGVDLFFSPAIR
ncbi:hypothetical protein JYT20_00025 [Rhodothermus sp. AH-315-K08]|nr:hypothetical protein [Rhodothermus sp. AH-315-K08]